MKRRVLFCVLLLGVSSLARAISGYLQAPFDAAASYTGSGPLATGGPWDPAGVSLGTGSLINENSVDSSVYVDPASGLGGSAKGLRHFDALATGGRPQGAIASYFNPDPSVSGPTQTSPYWIEYRFRLDPGLPADNLGGIETNIYDGNPTWPGIINTRTIPYRFPGPDTTPYLHYTILHAGGGPEFAILANLAASDEWRVLIKVDPVAGTQTHWVWKNGNTVYNSVLGHTYPLIVAQTTPLQTLWFQTNRELAVTFVLDQLKVTSTGPPPEPSGLKAWPQSAGRVDLQWTDNATTETGFIVERSLDGQTGWTTLTAPPLGQNTTTYSDLGVTAKTKYYYRVSAVGSGGTSAASNTTWAVTVYNGKPLFDWVNVKTTACGGAGQRPCAVGDGVTDDTEAIQKAINSLTAYFGYPTPSVLYFPNGTYKISDTLIMEGQIGAQIVGESTSGVIMKWGGCPGLTNCAKANPDGCTCATPMTGRITAKPMFFAEGNRNNVYRNITWDGGWDGTAAHQNYVVGFDLSYCGNCESPGCTSGANYNPKCDDVPGNPWFAGKPCPGDPTRFCVSADKGFADVASATLDSVFRNSWIGLRISHYNTQDSELTMRRCQFLSNAIGASVEDANALDEWFWDCKFDNNTYYGLSNDVNDLDYDGTVEGDGTDWAGDFRVLRGRFSNNGRGAGVAGSLWNRADIGLSPTGDFTMRECTSIGSGQFLFGFGYAQTSAPVSVIKSTIDAYDPNANHLGRAIDFRHSGTLFLLDNQIDSGNGANPVWATTAWPLVQADVLAMHNSYTTSDPYDPPAGSGMKLRNIDDHLVLPFTATMPAMPTVLDSIASKPVYTVTDGNTIQKVIDAATADPNPAIVYFPGGTYSVGQTITIGSSSRLLLLGNGTSSEILWTGPAGGTMFDVDGKALNGLTLRDLLLKGDTSGGSSLGTSLKVKDVNQDDSRVYLSRVDAADTTSTGILVNGLDKVKVDFTDLLLSDNLDMGLSVQAGPQPQQGTSVWTGLAVFNEWDFDALNNVNGVKLLVSSVYQEQAHHYARARGQGGAGDVSIHGAKIATQYSTQTNALAVQDFTGNFSMINCHMFDTDASNEGARIEQTGTSAVNIQAMASTVWWDPEHTATSGTRFLRVGEKYGCYWFSKDDTINGCGDPSAPGFVSLVDQDCTGSSCGSYSSSADPLLDAGVNLLRNQTMPGHYDESGASATHQLNLDNVFIWGANQGIVLDGGIPAAPSGLTAASSGVLTINLNWTDNSTNENGFAVERATSSSGPFSVVGTTGPNPPMPYVDNAPVEATTYYYRVKAFRTAIGDSAPSGTANATTSLFAPTNLAAAATGSTTTALTWTDNSPQELGTKVERSPGNPNNFVQIQDLATANRIATTDSGLTPGGLYYYRARCYKGGVNSAYSNNASVYTQPNAATNPSPANNATNQNWNPGPTLSWTAGTGAVTHDVYFGTSQTNVTNATRGNPLGVLVSTNQSGTTYPSGTLVKKTNYYWRIDEVAADGTTIKTGTVWTFKTKNN